MSDRGCCLFYGGDYASNRLVRSGVGPAILGLQCISVLSTIPQRYSKINTVSGYDQEYHYHNLQTKPQHRSGSATGYLHYQDIQTTIKQSIQLSLSRQDDCKTRKDIKNAYQQRRAQKPNKQCEVHKTTN